MHQLNRTILTITVASSFQYFSKIAIIIQHECATCYYFDFIICVHLTNNQIYGTEIKAKPAEKFVKPIALVRSVGGYWNDVNAGIMAFATPVVLFPISTKMYEL